LYLVGYLKLGKPTNDKGKSVRKSNLEFLKAKEKLSSFERTILLVSKPETLRGGQLFSS
jgi:hypothetical protein